MSFLRSRLSLVAATVLGGHVTAVAAAALVLCCFSHPESPEPGDHCPLHLGHSAPSPDHAGQPPGHEGHGRVRDVLPASHHASGDDCQMRCNEELTPASAVGPQALMTSAVAVLFTLVRAERVDDLRVGAPTAPSRIATPPPRA